MQTNLLWTGIEHYSLENCLVNTNEMGSEIDSTIVGKYGDKIYRVEYQITTNHNWETIYFEIHSQHSDHKQRLTFQSDGKGNWKNDGKNEIAFKGCIDIDIPLTPFTNTLPINRLKLANSETRQIKVLYLDLLEHRILPVTQEYRRLSDNEYHYQNVPNDFEAKIVVDELGFVVDYPSLFVRTASLKADYK